MRTRPVPEPVQDWYRIDPRNETSGDAEQTSADVYIYDAIGGWWGVNASEFVQDLAALDVDRINLYVNSPGGSVFDAVAIMNAIRRHRAHVVATVDGLAASAASYVIQAADEIVMARGSSLMIHDAWGLCIGNADDMAEFSAQLDRLSGSIAGLYAGRAGGTRDEWRDAMKAETWYTAEEAVEAGLADRADADPSDDAKQNTVHDLSIFAHAGRAAAPAPFMPAAHARATTRPPAELVDTHNPSMEGADTMSDALKAGLRDRLGIPDAVDLDDEAILAKVDEALAAPHTPDAGIPPGTVLLDEATLAELRADAQAGREARDEQIKAERERLVQAAIDDGRIAPARRDHWLASLKEDPGSASVLASLAPGTVPLTPAGYTGGINEASDEDRLYSRFYGHLDTPKGP